MTDLKNDQERGRQLKVAVIGGGPGGLAGAIELAKLPFVDWKLYEKKAEISETGGGLTIQPQTWKLLERNGAAEHILESDFYRSSDGLIEQRCNGRTGQLLLQKPCPKDTPYHRQSGRCARSKLQTALLRQVDRRYICVGKKLVGLEQLPDSRVRLVFADGDEDEVDLVVAADGIRSVVRKFCFPNHSLTYNGQSVYRAIISKAKAAAIPGIPWAATFWKHISGLYVYTCPLGDDDFEVTMRIRRPHQPGQPEPVSWGHPFDLHTLLDEYRDFCPPVRQILELAAKEGNTQEYAMFSGTRLESAISSGNIAFVGDAAHALLGNFGSGAGFALEDVYALGRALEWAWNRRPSKDQEETPLAQALDLFDSIRSPHYQRLYKILDNFKAIKVNLHAEHRPVDEEIAERVKRISDASEEWMYDYDIVQAVDDTLALLGSGSEVGECVEVYPNSCYYFRFVRKFWVYLVLSLTRILGRSKKT
ncbi:hypothetical protein QBC37DRAFT_72796 [Rhypophila decipiens]|uniref:FAD-binding domain-containing protein n=1 Tax=Rhypophila decipiens TaxID=261697 RepID=A0AAN6YND0_9PEZI|nr:hypothetical protein QBC37DRAFT_72796 [Rhypophila decipiens]